VRTFVVVLAAGDATRFGSPKMLAMLHGRPMLQHVLDAVADAGLTDVAVVLGSAAREVEAGITWRGELRVPNPRPQDGLASSVRLGLDAAVEHPSHPDAALIVLGDQPTIRAGTIRSVLSAAAASDLPIARPRYGRDGALNPVLIRRSSWALAAGLSGDRGLRPWLDQHPEMALLVPVEGGNPDVDTPGELTALEADGAIV